MLMPLLWERIVLPHHVCFFGFGCHAIAAPLSFISVTCQMHAGRTHTRSFVVLWYCLAHSMPTFPCIPVGWGHASKTPSWHAMSGNAGSVVHKRHLQWTCWVAWVVAFQHVLRRYRMHLIPWHYKYSAYLHQMALHFHEIKRLHTQKSNHISPERRYNTLI